jgi:hypothetical protein
MKTKITSVYTHICDSPHEGHSRWSYINSTLTETAASLPGIENPKANRAGETMCWKCRMG